MCFWAVTSSNWPTSISSSEPIKTPPRALELPNVMPASTRDQGCLDAARILARLIAKASSDDKLQAERERLTRNFLGRTIVLLREAIDTNPKLADQIKADADIKALESRS